MFTDIWHTSSPTKWCMHSMLLLYPFQVVGVGWLTDLSNCGHGFEPWSCIGLFSCPICTGPVCKSTSDTHPFPSIVCGFQNPFILSSWMRSKFNCGRAFNSIKLRSWVQTLVLPWPVESHPICTEPVCTFTSDTHLVPPTVYIFCAPLIPFRLWELGGSLIYQIVIMGSNPGLAKACWTVISVLHIHIWHTSNPINCLWIPESLYPFKLQFGEIKLCGHGFQPWYCDGLLSHAICIGLVCTFTSDTHPIPSIVQCMWILKPPPP